MEKLSGSIYDLKSLYTANGPNNLIAAMLFPQQHQGYFAVNIATEATTNPAAQWTANAEAQFNGDFTIRTKARPFENIVLTASDGDSEGSAILGGAFIAYPTQRFILIQWSAGKHSFVTPNGFAVRPAAVGVKGSPLILQKFHDRPDPGQVWISRT